MSSAISWLSSAICIDGFIIVFNFIEFVLILKTWKSVRTENMLLCSLCLSDFLCGTVVFIEDLIQLKSFSQKNYINEQSTAVYFFDSMFIFFILVSNLHIMSIAMKRLIAELLPSVYLKCNRKRWVVANLCIIWLIASVLAPAISILPKVMLEKKITMFAFVRKLYGGIFITACILVFITYFTLFMLLVVREKKIRQKMKDELLPCQMKIELLNRRNTYLYLILGIAFLVCVLPYSLGLANKNLYHPFWNLLIVLNHIVNPIVYFLTIYFERRGNQENDRSHLVTNEITMGEIKSQDT